jgi:hypothetical protein
MLQIRNVGRDGILRDQITGKSHKQIGGRNFRSVSSQTDDEDFIFRPPAIGTNNFCSGFWRRPGPGLKKVNHQVLLRTCSTYMAQFTTVKDVQAHLPHGNAATTPEYHIESVPADVRIAVESLDPMLKSIPEGSEGKRSWTHLNPASFLYRPQAEQNKDKPP